MKKNYAFAVSALTIFIFLIFSCSDSDDENYEPIDPVSPVVVDLTQVPYQKLSDYKFFEGAMKNQTPSLGVLPYRPSSSLFSDYAHKNRFVWMPNGTKATYVSDNAVLELPVGAALIKTFYYDDVQNAPNPGDRRILETRVMIRKADGWIFADYVWNEDQTEALLDLNGSTTQVSFIDENDVPRTADYRIPNEFQCFVCHKSQDASGNPTYIPIGIKPQNLNFDYNYGSEVKNQLTKWAEYGYLDTGFSLPSANNSTVDYNDASKPVDVRARSYVDANCAHCHMANRHCDYRPMRFAFSETAGESGLENMGVCVDTEDMQDLPSNLNKIVMPRNVANSMLFYRINTVDETYRMPLHGRTLIHDEGVALMQEWINSLEECE